MNIEVPDIFADQLSRFSPTELEKLRVLLTSPEYLKLLGIAECMKPSPNCAGAGSGSRDAFSDGRATARLGEIRGWQLHQAALLAALAPRKEVKQTMEEFQPLEVTDKP